MNSGKILRFKTDTKHRKDWFTGMSFSHPAKMSLPLQLWVVENYTKAGETILDPMAGSGTVLVACSMGRNVIAVELEKKFVDMMNKNWEKVEQRGAQLGYEMGWCKVICGDARQLEAILCNVKQSDVVVSSPPYGNPRNTTEEYDDKYDLRRPKGIAWGRESFRGRYGDTPGQIGDLPYGDIDKIITSPPYAEAIGRDAKYYEKIDTVNKKRALGMYGGQLPSYTANLKYSYVKDNMGETEGNIGNLPYGQINHIITSPPYEGSLEKPLQEGHSRPESHSNTFWKGGYSETAENIGNLKSTSYLEAMALVYSQCWKVLRPQGLMILVVKPFIRNKKIVPLQEHTKSLCVQAGFSFLEEHYRILPSQSFWRTIYQQRYPDAPVIDKEYVLVFEKSVGISDLL